MSQTLTIFSIYRITPVEVLTLLTVVSLRVIETDEAVSIEIVTASGIGHVDVAIAVTRLTATPNQVSWVAVVTRSTAGNKQQVMKILH